MHRSLLVPLGMLAGILALGCGDNAGVTDPTTAAAPSFGAVVTRLEAPSPQIVIDTEQGLTALFGVSFEELPAVCAGGELHDLADLLIVSHPSRGGETVFKFRVKDKEQSAIVWAAIVQESPCELQDVQPLAVGTVHSMYTDNDFFNTNPGTEAVSVQAEGTVTSPATAQSYHLLATFHRVISPDGTEKVTGTFVRLTPIGG
jgi:hypothetical protein